MRPISRRGFLGFSCGAVTTIAGCTAFGRSDQPPNEVELTNVSGSPRTIEVTVTTDAGDVLLAETVTVETDTHTDVGVFRGRPSKLRLIVDDGPQMTTEWPSTGMTVVRNGTERRDIPEACDERRTSGVRITIKSPEYVGVLASCDTVEDL